MKTPHELSAALQECLGDNLKSVVLYGSAVSAERTKKFSDYNVLVVVEDLWLPTLKALGPLAKAWIKAGNPPPLFFTDENLANATDVFPIEFLDIQERHKILFGDNPFEKLNINRDHLRHQLEYELRGKFIQLRERYLEQEGKPGPLMDLLGRALSTFTVLFKGVLRLVGESVPEKRPDVWMALKKHASIDVEAFQLVLAHREGEDLPSNVGVDDVFARFLRSVQAAINFVDSFHR